MNRSILTAILTCAATFAANAELTWADKDHHYGRQDAITVAVSDTTLGAWRGERLGAVALFRPQGGSEADVTARLDGPLKGEARFMDYVLTDSFRRCGTHPSDLEAYEVPDVIGDRSCRIGAGELRPIWVSLEIPQDCPPGDYKEKLTVDGEEITLTVTVADRRLKAPAERDFYLNLWQQPYSVSRYYGVEPWSDEHFKLLEPYARMLARAGQKTISTILFFEPWGEQSNDLFLPMVETFRNQDGTWDYDYTVFDKWVDFMTANGVGPDIECFSMVPWDMNFRYFDRATGEYKFLKTTTDSEDYKDLWSAFLTAFTAHLKEKGLFERTVIAMDERSMADMRNAIGIIDSVDPRLKISLAGNYHPELADRLYSLTITQGEMFPPGLAEKRREKGQITSLYTCCSSPAPNLFSNSEPADAAWLPVHCVATGNDGYLHWSFMNWTDDPLTDTRFKLFAPGDTYFVYPDGKSSVRFERLLEGIELSEKIKTLRKEFIKSGNTSALAELDDALIMVAHPRPVHHASTASQINHINRIITKYGSTKK